MNEIFFHMADYKKNNPQNKTKKTFETNITSEKGEDKSKSKSNSQTIYQNNPIPKKHINLYLIQYQKYFNKKLVIKYNILPNEYTLMKLDNFITAKYCHSLASFKEKLIFNYDEEFLNRFYSKKDAKKKIPLFAEFYKSYLKFFCFPTLSELKLNDLIEDMVEKKAKAFYNENFSEKNEKSEKKINVVIFTNKIRKDISRRNSLTNLTKTTIRNHSNTNKSSVSLVTIEKIFNEMNNEKIKKNNNNKKNININNNYKNNNNLKNENNSNSINKGIKNSVILNKMKKKIKIEVKDNNNISNNTSNKSKNNNTVDYTSNGKRKKMKNKISRNIQNKLLDNKYSTINSKKTSTIKKKMNSIFINSNINFNKIIYNNNPIENQKKLSTSKNNSKNLIESKNKEKENKKKQTSHNNKIISKKYSSTINNNYNIKNNTLISIFNSTTHENNNINTNNINNNTNKNNNINNNINKNKNFNFIIHKTISNNNNNIQNNIKKIIKKPSNQKIKPKNQIKSRNYNIINDNNINSVYSTQIKNELNDFTLKNENKDNIFDYYTINNKQINTVSVKISNQKSKPKIKLIKADNNNKAKTNNNQNINDKVLNIIGTRKNINSNLNYKKDNDSSSSSLKYGGYKKHFSNNIKNYIGKNRVVDSKNNIKMNTKSYTIFDSQKIIKNLKIVTNKENNSKNKIYDYKVKISKNK